MSLFFPTVRKCGVCGSENKVRNITSTNTFGACDLDLRPSEMKRSTMPYWVEECSVCGYVATNISTLPPNLSEEEIKKVISSETYLKTEGNVFLSDIAVKFYKQYLLAKSFKTKKEAFNALLHAAWACDDKEDKANAIMCRKKALEFLEILILENEDNHNLILLKADLLRRSKEFDTVVNWFDKVEFTNELLNKILRFQIEKSKLCDDGCYTVSDV